MTDFAQALRLIELEDNVQQQHFILKQTRDFLAGALCAVCGEPLGYDEEIISDSEDRTIHKKCESSEKQYDI